MYHISPPTLSPGGGGGGHSSLNRNPCTAKRQHGTEAVNAKIQGRSTPFGPKKGGRSTLN